MSQRRHAITLSDGTIIFGLSGSDGEDEEQEPDDDAEGAQGGDDDGDDGDGEEDELSLEDIRAQLAEALTSKADVERRMRMADRTASRYRTENEELKRGKTQAEANAEVTLEDQVKDLNAQLAERRGGDTRGQIRDEFLGLDKYDWHNRSVAFNLLDISDVAVDERGRVDRDALEDKVATLVQDNPYLVKTAEKKTKDEDKPDRPSGAQPGSHRRDRKQVDREALKKKYPQLYRS